MKSHSPVTIRLIVFTCALVVAAGFGLLWWFDNTKPVDLDDTRSITFNVGKGEGVRSIAADLADDGLIRSPTAFFLLVKIMGIERRLEAGDFHLSPAMDAKTVATTLTHGSADVWVTTLEGWRKEEIASELAKNFGIPESEFIRLAQEGYMFPDTYRIPQDATAGAIVDIFKDTFHAKVSKDYEALSRKIGLTFDEVVVLASIVEREGQTDEDRPVIAGILLKRLEAGWPLQTDATLQYALGYQSQQKSWWKKELTLADKEIDSEYNTYLHTGLPPGPISNPGLSALQSVLNPINSEYWFYLHDLAGGVHYGRTLEEHSANIENYLLR